MLLKQKNISYDGSLSNALFHHNKELEMEEYAQSLKESFTLQVLFHLMLLIL